MSRSTEIMIVVEWLVAQPMLAQHILNGAARGLYPWAVAEEAQNILEQHNKQIKLKEVSA